MADEIQVQVMYVISEQQLREPVSDSASPPLNSCFLSLGTSAPQGLNMSEQETLLQAFLWCVAGTC